MLKRSWIAIAFIFILVLQLVPVLSGAPALAAPEPPGVTVAYTVTVTAPPQEGITIEAVFQNLAAPGRLELGFATHHRDFMQGVRDLRFFAADGTPLTHRVIDQRSVAVDSAAGTVVARYSIDLDKVDRGRNVNVTDVGGILTGYTALFVPVEQPLADARARFVLPKGWSLVTHQRPEGEWQVINPDTFTDLRLETKISGWFFGVVDFDETRTYADGFRVRVVGFKGREYRHWNAYMDGTALDQALLNADEYHAAYLELKQIFGSYPFKEILLVGPGLWQAGATWEIYALYPDREFPLATHHMVHAYLGHDGDVTPFSVMGYGNEGLSTWAEGLLMPPRRGDFNFRGMVYERKIHYLRGLKFGNTAGNWQSYPYQFVLTYLMDHEIKRQTGGQKDIYDLFVTLWQRYRRVDRPTMATNDQVLAVLTELTGQDWRPFFRQNIERFDAVDTAPLEELNADFQVFVRQVADLYYAGHPSLYFVNQELVSAAGDFQFAVRFQSPFHTTAPVSLGTFALAARKHKDLSTGDLTESEIIAILKSVTGKDHTDFFTFYRGLGLTVDPADISEGLRSFSFDLYMGDQAVRLTPRTIPLGSATTVEAEIIDPGFASGVTFGLQVDVYDLPHGLADARDLVSGEGVCFAEDREVADGNLGPARRFSFEVPKTVREGRTYTRFTLNMPTDAGMLEFSMFSRHPEGQNQGELITPRFVRGTGTTQAGASPARSVPCSASAGAADPRGPATERPDLVRLTQAEVTLGRPSVITAELVSPDFAQAQALRLQLNIYKMPRGVASVQELVKGDGVRFLFDRTGVQDSRGSLSQAIYDLPRYKADGKTYTAFTLNLPVDAGVIDYLLNAGPEHDSSLFQVPLVLRIVQAPVPPVVAPAELPGGGFGS
ncbi:MAG TPA: hypothetical protein VD969_09345 [Symbiobacteriaceae bacterium]|nr:hypothetical protein [Symbiobacteriaceae bacterium]